jgi:hypothetical protein
VVGTSGGNPSHGLISPLTSARSTHSGSTVSAGGGVVSISGGVCGIGVTTPTVSASLGCAVDVSDDVEVVDVTDAVDVGAVLDGTGIAGSEDCGGSLTMLGIAVGWLHTPSFGMAWFGCAVSTLALSARSTSVVQRCP